MDCLEVISLMDEYLKNRLPEEVSRGVALHIRECISCMVKMNISRAMVTAFSSLPDKKAPVRLADAVMEQILMEYDVSDAEDSSSFSDRLAAFWTLTSTTVKPSWNGVKVIARSFSFARYMPRPTLRIRWGDDRQSSLTKLPLAMSFRW